jgi:type II secretory pathway component GspD/PulD (secretin)
VQARNEVRVLSRPRGLVKNGEKLTLSSGVRILVPTNVSVDPFNNITTTLRLEPVATRIEATPHIVGPHTVAVTLTVQVQDLLRETPPEEIKTSDRTITTEVVLNEGENLLGLGGLYRKRTQVVETGIPLLSDIPLLGYLFKSYGRSQSTFELHVYLRVYIERVDKPEGSERLIIPDDLRKR